jgi:hypothetical protein
MIGKELFEDIIDKQTITEYEARDRENGVKFVDSDDIIKMMQNRKSGGTG